MESHARWLVRIGAFFVGLSPYTSYDLKAALESGFRLPESWSPWRSPETTLIYFSYKVSFHPLSALASLLYLGAPVLATFPALRNQVALRRIQVGLLLIFCMAGVFFGSIGPAAVPLIVRLGIPILTAGWIVSLMVLAFDADLVGRWARALTALLLITELLLFSIGQPRWLIVMSGVPVGLAGAALMTAGELFYPWPKPAIAPIGTSAGPPAPP